MLLSVVFILGEREDQTLAGQMVFCCGRPLTPKRKKGRRKLMEDQ
jgi:hypothetical protein